MTRVACIAILVLAGCLILQSSRGASPEPQSTPARIHFQIVATPNENQPYPKWNYLTSVSAFSANEIWSVGASTIHYDGQTWTAFAAPKMTGNGSNILNGVAEVSPTDVWAVGYINSQLVGKYQSAIIEHFDGSSWQVFPSPQFAPPITSFLTSITAVSANDIWAAGEVFEDPFAFPLLEHFDGTVWTQVGPPVSDCTVWAISADAANDAWAAGSTLGGATCTLHYDGSVWALVASPNGGFGYNELNGVVSLSPTNAWAAGWYIQNPNDDRPTLTLVEHWDGSQWQIVPSPNAGTDGKDSSRLRGIFAASPNDIWGMGEGTVIASDMSYNLILHWDGAKWKIIPSPDVKNKNILNDTLDAGVAVPGSIWMVGSNNVFSTLVMKGVVH